MKNQILQDLAHRKLKAIRKLIDLQNEDLLKAIEQLLKGVEENDLGKNV